jgi:glycosyltransferase involved in cell wall biosynthesis
MRAAAITGAAADAGWDVRVAVVPVAGHLPTCPRPVAVPVTDVVPSGRTVLARRFAALVADPRWRTLLAAADPLPGPARAAPVALADDVVGAAGVGPGTPVVVLRSYLAPLALAVAQLLHAPWSALDLDDDDEAMAAAGGDDATAAAYGRLVATMAPHFDAVSLASPLDAAVLGRRHGLDTHVVPNAVRIPDVVTRHPEPGGVLFVANLGYEPNVHAARLLVEQVLPALEAATGDRVRVTLVGAFDPHGPVAALAAQRAVTLTGFVDDLDDHYARAAVVVAPLATGSGTRIKLLEAFAHGVPVVTTPVGMAGLAVRPGEHVLVGETPQDLAEAAAEVLGSPARAEDLAAAALTFVRRHHAQPVVAERVRAFLSAASARGDVRR